MAFWQGELKQRIAFGVVLGALAWCTGCGGTMSPSAPPIDISGTWKGSRTFEYSVSNPPVSIDCHYTEGDTLVLSQSGGSLSGTLTMNWHLVSGPRSPVGQNPGCALDNVCPGDVSGSIAGSSVQIFFAKQSCYQGDITWVGSISGQTMSGTTQPSPLVVTNGNVSVTEIFQPWSVTR